MNAKALVAMYDGLTKSDWHWLEAEVVVRMERYLACFNYMAKSPTPSSDREYESVVNEMTEAYNLPRGLWDEGFNDAGIDHGFVTRAVPLIRKWVRGTMTSDEWADVTICLDEDLDTDMIFFLYGIPHSQKPDDVDLLSHAERFGQRNQK